MRKRESVRETERQTETERHREMDGLYAKFQMFDYF